MGERDVARDSRLDGERQPDDLRLHRVEARGLGIEAHELGALDLTPAIAPAWPRPAPSRSVAARRGGASARRGARARIVERARERAPGAIGAASAASARYRDRAGVASARDCRSAAVRATWRGIATGAVAKPLLEFEALVERFAIVRHPQLAAPRSVGACGSAQSVFTVSRRLPCGSQSTRRAQILADDAGNLAGVRDHVVERAVLREPFCRRLRSHLRHARHVVDGVAGERQEVQHLIGADAEFREHARLVQRLVAHRVDELDPGTHELREILVGGRDHAIDAGGRRLLRRACRSRRPLRRLRPSAAASHAPGRARAAARSGGRDPPASAGRCAL